MTKPNTQGVPIRLANLPEFFRTTHRPRFPKSILVRTKLCCPGGIQLKMENAVVNVPHQVLYGAFAITYLASCFGLDKMLVAAALATGYAILALSKH